MSESERGMRCARCGETHTEWQTLGEPYTPSPDASGRLQKVECGRCGSTDAVGVP